MGPHRRGAMTEDPSTLVHSPLTLPIQIMFPFRGFENFKTVIRTLPEGHISEISLEIHLEHIYFTIHHPKSFANRPGQNPKRYHGGNLPAQSDQGSYLARWVGPGPATSGNKIG